MIKFIELTRSGDKFPVKSLFNLNHITMIEPYTTGINTKIWFDDSAHTVVNESYEEVSKLLLKALT